METDSQLLAMLLKQKAPTLRPLVVPRDVLLSTKQQTALARHARAAPQCSICKTGLNADGRGVVEWALDAPAKTCQFLRTLSLCGPCGVCSELPALLQLQTTDTGRDQLGALATHFRDTNGLSEVQEGVFGEVCNIAAARQVLTNKQSPWSVLDMKGSPFGHDSLVTPDAKKVKKKKKKRPKTPADSPLPSPTPKKHTKRKKQQTQPTPLTPNTTSKQKRKPAIQTPSHSTPAVKNNKSKQKKQKKTGSTSKGSASKAKRRKKVQVEG